MKLGFSYKFLFYLLLIVVLAYIALKHFKVIEGKTGPRGKSSGSHADEVDSSLGLIVQSIGGGGAAAGLT